MPDYSAEELRYGRPIAEAIIGSADFRHYLFCNTNFSDAARHFRVLPEEQAKLRSPRLRNPYWFNNFCGKDGRCTCKVETGIETDILFILEQEDGRRVALHIEVKRPGDVLHPGQAESYPKRAACWLNNETRQKTILAHDSFVTMIVCGRDLADDERLHFFDKVVFHDDLERLISNYPESADRAF